MDVTPQDLGPLGEPVVRAREQDGAYLRAGRSFTPSPSPWGVPAVGCLALGGPLAALVGGVAGVGLGCLCFLAVCVVGGLALYGHHRHNKAAGWEPDGPFEETADERRAREAHERAERVHAPLTVAEARGLRDSAAEPLQVAYLGLVLAAVEAPGDGAASPPVREALRALGESLAGPAATEGVGPLPDLRRRNIERRLDALRARLGAGD